MSGFTEAIESGNLAAVRKFAKSDLHNHGMMGGRISRLTEFFGNPVAPFNLGFKGVQGINEWIGKVLKPVIEKPGAFAFLAGSAFEQAKEDGVTVLEMSIDALLGNLIQMHPSEMVTVLKEQHQRIAPEIDFHPELGLSRSLPLRNIFNLVDKYLETGFFRSVDLYDIEDAQPVENFRELYRLLKKEGLKLKAHAGEFGDADSVRKSVDVLELDAVQHGIGAAGSSEVMKWLATNKTVLNISPESNIILGRTKSYKTHPIRILYDYGVKVTISTDDVLLFDKGNSEQYLELFNSGAFSASELEEIRQNGLEA